MERSLNGLLFEIDFQFHIIFFVTKNLGTRLKGRLARSFGHHVTVAAVEDLTPDVRLLRFQGEDLAQLGWQPGDKIKLQVGDSVLRSYTPSGLDRARGTMDVVIHLHGHGPGSNWARAAQPGTETVFMGPAKSMSRPDRAPAWAMFFGDETAAGLARALFDWLPAGTPRLGALELDPTNLGLVEALELDIAELTREGSYGDRLVEWLHDSTLPEGEGVVWLSGEVSSVVRLRDALRERGVVTPQVRLKPYWSLRGTAHRKTVEARLKR